MKMTKASRFAALLLALLLCAPFRADAARLPCSRAAEYPSCPAVRFWSRPAGCAFPGADGGVPSVPDFFPDTDSPAVPEGGVPSFPDFFPDTDSPAVPDDAPAVPGTDDAPAAPETDASILPYEAEVVRLVNEVRARNGLNALTADGNLCRFARLKSQDMRDNRYFSHDSPTYGTPFQMMKSLGVSYRTAGENIAYGYASPQAVMDGWMNSEGHRANILNPSYTRIGVGYVADGQYWTQWFIG